MKIVFALGLCSALLVAAPANAEICSRISTNVLDATPSNAPSNLHGDFFNSPAMGVKDEQEADRIVRQMMRRDLVPLFAPDHGMAAGWPCLRTLPVRMHDEVVRQRQVEDAADVVGSVGAVARGVGIAVQAFGESTESCRHAVKECLVENKAAVQDKGDLGRMKAKLVDARKSGAVHAPRSAELQRKIDAARDSNADIKGMLEVSKSWAYSSLR